MKMKDGIRNFLKINGLFLLMAMFVLGGFLVRDSRLEASLVSHPDAEVVFSTEEGILEQTWAPYMKNITGLKVPFTAENDFEGTMNVTVFTDNYGQEVGTFELPFRFTKGEQGELVFSGGSLKVDIGSRYRFRFQYAEDSGKGSIRIPSGSGHAGCTIGEKDQGQAVALKILFTKNSRIFWVMITFLPFLLFSLFFCVLWDRRMEETLGFSFILVPLLLFLFGLGGQLEAGIFAVFLLSSLCFVGTVILVNRKKSCLFRLFTPGLAAYGCMAGFLMVFCQNLFRKEYDEYSHWGLAVKDMFYYDAFAKHVGSSVVFKRYPPFSTLIEYFFVYTNGIFSEGLLYVAYLALVLSLLLIALKNCTWKNRGHFLLSLLVVILLPMVFYGHFYSLYVDFMLMALFAYILLCYFSEKMSLFNALRIMAGLMALTLTKETGVILAGLAVMAMGGDLLLSRWRRKEKPGLKGILPVLLSLVLLAVTFFGWQRYMSIPAKETADRSAESASEEGETAGAPNRDASGDAASNGDSNGEESGREDPAASLNSTVATSNISAEGLMELLSGNAEEYKYEAIRNFWETLWFGKTYYVGYFSFSYLVLGMMVVLAGWAAAKKKWGLREADRLPAFGILSLLAAVGYALFLLVAYLFAFPESEVLILASHERYLASCMGGIMVALCGLLVMASHKERLKENIWLIVLGAVLLTGVPIEKLIPSNVESYITEDTVYGFDEIEEVARTFADKSESIYIYNNSLTDEKIERILFRNYISPLESDGNVFFASQEAFEKEKRLFKEEYRFRMQLEAPAILSEELWRENMKRHEYVFIKRPGYVFEESYGGLFEDPGTIGERSFYRVVEKDGEPVFRYVGVVK